MFSPCNLLHCTHNRFIKCLPVASNAPTTTTHQKQPKWCTHEQLKFWQFDPFKKTYCNNNPYKKLIAKMRHLLKANHPSVTSIGANILSEVPLPLYSDLRVSLSWVHFAASSTFKVWTPQPLIFSHLPSPQFIIFPLKFFLKKNVCFQTPFYFWNWNLKFTYIISTILGFCTPFFKKTHVLLQICSY